MGKLSGPCTIFLVGQRTVDLLAKACAHAGMKAIGMKTAVITSATFAIGVRRRRRRNMNKWMVWSFSARKSSDVL